MAKVKTSKAAAVKARAKGAKGGGAFGSGKATGAKNPVPKGTNFGKATQGGQGPFGQFGGSAVGGSAG